MMALPFLVPFHRLPIPSFESEWLALVFGVAGMLALVASRRCAVLPLPQIALAPLALGLLVLVQLATGMLAYAANGVIMLAFLGWACGLAVAGSWASASFGTARLFAILAGFVLAGGVLSALAGMLQYAGWDHLARSIILPLLGDRSGVYGNLAQQNHFATHIALALVSLLYLHRAGRLTIRVTLPVAALLLAALVLSGSRSSLLYLGWMLLVSRRLNDTRRWWTAAATFAAALAALWLAAHFSLLGPQLARLTAIGEALGPRAYLWQHASAIFAQHPLIGVGIDGFAHALVEQLEEGARTWGIDQYPHNLALQLLATTGVAGFAAVFIPAGLFVRRVLRAPHAACSQWAWGILGTLAIHSMLEQPIYYAYFLGIAAFVAGAIDPRQHIAHVTPAMRATFAVVLSLGSVALLKTAVDYRALANNFYGPGRGDVGDARHDALLLSLHRFSLFMPMAELIGPQLFVAPDAPVGERIAFNQRVMRFAPVAEVEYRHAALLAEAGQVTAAKAQFARAARAYPAELPTYVERFAMVAHAQPLLFAEVAAYARQYHNRGHGGVTH